MSEKLIRAYRKLDVGVIKPQLLVYGDLAGTCENCGTLDIKIDIPKCPKCAAEFKYIAFRNVKAHLPKMIKLAEQRPSITMVDYDDYKHQLGAKKAEDFFK